LADELTRAGFRDVVTETIDAPLRMESAKECLRFERESFGALHQMLGALTATEREAAWSEVADGLRALERDGAFAGPCELVIAVGTK
jgi:hypothetical protein